MILKLRKHNGADEGRMLETYFIFCCFQFHLSWFVGNVMLVEGEEGGTLFNSLCVATRKKRDEKRTKENSN